MGWISAMTRRYGYWCGECDDEIFWYWRVYRCVLREGDGWWRVGDDCCKHDRAEGFK